MASVTEAAVFKEFCPLYSVVNAIPTKVQKGFRSILVYLTALHANGDYIAIGSSIGMLYLYCRHTNQMKKYNLEGKMESISVVRLLSCFDDLVAVGTVSGRVAIFQLVSPLPGRNKQLRRFDVLGVHKSNITALTWSPNGMKLFSGDDKGKIVQSDLDLDKGSCNSSLVLEELFSIVQLDYSQKVLLVSTTQRCLLFYTEEKCVKQVGNQQRKSGRYGACFIPGLCKQSDLTLFTSRPGLRVWKADAHGSVQSTYLLKDALSRELKSFELYPRAEPSHENEYTLPTKHLALLSCFLCDGWVLSWDEYSIYLIDTISQSVVGGLETSGDVVSVTSTNNEIFLIKGDRDIIRISDMPEGAVSAGLNSPLRVHTAVCPEGGRTQTGALSDIKESLETDTYTVKTERIQTELEDEDTEVAVTSINQNGSLTADVKSQSSSLNSIDSGFILNTTNDMSPSNVQRGSRSSLQRFSTISSEEFDQELIVQSIKVKKKKKKRQASESGPRNPDAGSLESTPSMDSPLTHSDFFSATPSLQSGSLDPLSSQESLVGGKCQSVLDDGSTDVFHAAPPETVAQVPSDDSHSDHEGNALHDIIDQNAVAANCEAESAAEPLGKPQVIDCVGSKICVKEDVGAQSDAEGSSILNLNPPKGSENSKGLIAGKNAINLRSLSLTVAEESDSLEISQRQSELLKEEKELLTTNMTCHVFSSFIGDYTPKNVYTSDAIRSYNTEKTDQTRTSESSDEEDIYSHRYRGVSPDVVAEMESDDMTRSAQEGALLKSEQLAESWMVYSGPASGILSLVVSEKYLWCLDYKGCLYCSALPGAGLRWQRFEDSVQQVAVSPSGNLLWKIEQKTEKAFACGKVTIKGKRHWYEALPQASFVALSDDNAWIIRTNGDLYLQTGLSVDRPCARAEKVDCPCPLSQITARNNVVWALTEQRGLLYREGVSSFSPEGDAWKCDLVSERQTLEPVCVALGNQETVWTLDAGGNLWFRTGVTSKQPEGEDDHWWQVSITDYVVFDHYTLFQTLIQATQTVATVAQAPVEKVADKLRMTFCSQQAQCQPSLLGVNSSGVWITSGKNEFHVAKGNLIGTYWHNIVPRGTASTTKWASVSASPSPTAEGSILWLCQSRKDLFCLTDLSPPFRPSTIQLPPDSEIIHLSACADALWALDNHGGVFIRTLSKTCPTGMHWTRLDLSQLGSVKLCSFTCGNQHIWACDTSGVIYFRVGTQPLNPSMMLPAWIMIEPPIQPVGINLVSVFSSPNDNMLWTIDNKYNVYVRIGITEEMPVGTDWEHVPGLQARQLAVSAKTVWARCPNGDIARRYGVTEKNSAGDYWKKIPGNAFWLTVTSLDELWALGTNGYLLQRLTKTYSHQPNITKNSFLVHSDFEDEWEVI